ncbi:MAG: hypothetical protein QOE35_2345 [Actinomycetota bacterium]
MTVAFDLQPIQSVQHSERGIARYVFDLARALQDHRGDAVSHFLLNPNLEVPARVAELQGGTLVRDSSRPAGVDVFHVTSPFELGLPLEQIWPLWARSGCRLVVTLYDLIPLLFPEHYQGSALVRAHYRSRLEIVRRADKVLTISEASARDAVDVLGLRPRQVDVVGAAPGPLFAPPVSMDATRAELARSLPSVRAGFLLYTGGVDWRKNIHGLISAYARLPLRLRAAHQLVVVCSVGDEHLIRFEENLDALGITDQVVFTGRVSDVDLLRLYQASELFVFPSLYEGYGLPVAEALASGAAVVCSRSSSLVEMIDCDEALFDPTDPGSISAAMQAALEDPARLDRLRRRERPLGHSWKGVAAATVDAYEQVLRRPVRRRPRRPRLAVVSPLPPTPSGVADYTAALLQHIRHWCDVDVFVEDSEQESRQFTDGLAVHSIVDFDRVEALRNGFDRYLYCIGNQTSHAGALELLRHRPGPVLAHDLRLMGLYAWCAQHRPELVPGGFQAFLHEVHPKDLPPELGARAFLDYREADQHEIFMAGRVIEDATAFFTHSHAASALARVEAGPAHAAKVETIPFAFPPVSARGRSDGPPLIATFGVADPIKQTPKVLEAFGLLAAAHPTLHLAIVGPMPPVVQDEYRSRAAELDVHARVHVTGRVTSEEYHDWLARATVAVQLRASWGGEASAAVADCLAHGVPTIATATGWTADLPADAIVPVSRDVSASDLSDVADTLLRDEVNQARLRVAGWQHARANSFRNVAEKIYRRVVLEGAGLLAVRTTASRTLAANAAVE